MKNPPSTVPRVALIGVSGYGRIYLDLARAAHARGEINLAAAVIINPETEAAVETQLVAAGCRIHRDYEEMLRQETGRLDLCLIPTGIPWHARMTLAALKAGAHVLVEKPLAGSLGEAYFIHTAEKAAGRFVAVGFQDIYSPANRWLKQQLCAGAIGQLQSVRFLGLWPRPATYFTRNPWAGRIYAQGTQVLDSPLNNAFAHFVNLCLYFAGAKPETSATISIKSAELLRAHHIESFDTSVVQARSTDGVEFWFGVTHTGLQVREPEIYLEGSSGRVEWKHDRNCVLIQADGRRVEWPLPDTTANRQTMFSSVLAKLNRPEEWVCNTTLAERHTAFVEAVHATAPIWVVPDKFIRWTAPAPGAAEVPVVLGLESAMVRAFSNQNMLLQNGFNPTEPTDS